ncbi:MAG TPA: S41 family peptidase, partial [Candidatus Dormibacteraeota bacterium]|nr:S41 family peptidase [Candidatus Dormibacteraeota bacterium]
LLRGKIGTNVTLTIERDGAMLPNPIVLTRAKIHQITVFDKMLPGKIGYLALTVFGATTGDEVSVALSRLLKEGARAFVLDLRDNGGGYLEAAVAVSSKFIADGPIVSIETTGKHIDTLEANGTAISPVPVAVLVNGNTASASEITTAALKESGTAVIIGSKTFGKGVVQTIFPLHDGGAVKITTARYLTPEYHYINHKGIIPNIVLKENKGARYGVPARDVQLRRAIQLLDGELTAQRSGSTPTL